MNTLISRLQTLFNLTIVAVLIYCFIRCLE